MSERIPFHKPALDDEDVEAVTRELRDGWLTMGPTTHSFETAFCKRIGSAHAVAVSSGTAALHLALCAIGLQAGDEVIVPDMTFTATGEVVTYFGAKPVIVDVDPSTLTIDPQAVERAIGKRTKAIIPVHYAGQPCRMDALLGLASDYDLLIVEDAAHSLPATYQGKMVGTIGDLTAFSFYATKTLTTGEGGMITSECGVGGSPSDSTPARHQQGRVEAVRRDGLMVLRGLGARIQVQPDRSPSSAGAEPVEEAGCGEREAGGARAPLH